MLRHVRCDAIKIGAEKLMHIHPCLYQFALKTEQHDVDIAQRVNQHDLLAAAWECTDQQVAFQAVSPP